MKNENMAMEIERLRHELRVIADMADEGRPLVNEICKSFRQIDTDAAAACCRGAFLEIAGKARGIVKQSMEKEHFIAIDKNKDGLAETIRESNITMRRSN